MKSELKPVTEHDINTNNDIIKGAVVYIDTYGNATTNISKNLFEQVRKGRDFVILFGREDERISKLREKTKMQIKGRN